MNQDKIRRPVASVSAGPQGIEEDIRQLAYQLYDLRGREDGHDLDDWLRAEEELKRQQSRTAAA